MNFKSALTSVLFLSLCFSFAPAPKALIGIWKIDKVILKTGKVKRDNDKWIEFKNDGTMRGGSNGITPHLEGTWKYNKKKKTLELKANPSNKDDGEYQVLKLTSTELELMKDSVRVYLIPRPAEGNKE